MQKCRFLPMLSLLLVAFCSSGWAQLSREYHPIAGRCCLLAQMQQLTTEMSDWNQLGRYYADNVQLEAQPVPEGRVVFLGDSITDIWNLAQFFPGKPYVDRGIGGQTTAQMLVRMYPDVIDLHPAAVIILAGTNDIAQTTGPQTARMIEENFKAMVELAQAHQIKVILCSLTPVSDYTQYKQTVRRPPADILELNAWLKQYAAQVHAGFADYYSAVVDSQGMFREGDSNDGLHPNDKGFALMAPVAEAAIEKALAH